MKNTSNVGSADDYSFLVVLLIAFVAAVAIGACQHNDPSKIKLPNPEQLKPLYSQITATNACVDKEGPVDWRTHK